MLPSKRVSPGKTPFRRFTNRGLNSMTALWIIVLCGALAIVYAVWATRSVMAADAGNARMQEIAAAVREGAQAYLKRQYTTIGIVGVVIFVIVWLFPRLAGRRSASPSARCFRAPPASSA